MALFTIGYDASTTLGKRTGVGRAALEVLKAMVKLDDPRFEFKVLLTSFLRSPGREHEFLFQSPKVEVRRSRRPGSWLVSKWAQGRGPTAESLLGSHGIFHAPASYVPPVDSARRVVSVYDLAFLDDAQLDSLGGALFKKSFPKVLPECQAVHASSEHTRQRLLEAYALPPEKVRTIPLGIDHQLFQPAEERMVEITAHQIGLMQGDYLLAITSLGERKRNGLLLEVYEALRKDVPATPPLVVLGWEGVAPRELKEKPHLYKWVHVLNRLDDQWLPGLYSGALVTLLTSREEGFGFPLLEAQACGSAVVCSNGSTFSEFGSEAATLVTGTDAEEWGQAVCDLMFDTELRRTKVQLGVQNAAQFSWEKTARGLLDLYALI